MVHLAPEHRSFVDPDLRGGQLANHSSGLGQRCMCAPYHSSLDGSRYHDARGIYGCLYTGPLVQGDAVSDRTQLSLELSIDFDSLVRLEFPFQATAGTKPAVMAGFPRPASGKTWNRTSGLVRGPLARACFPVHDERKSITSGQPPA